VAQNTKGENRDRSVTIKVCPWLGGAKKKASTEILLQGGNAPVMGVLRAQPGVIPSKNMVDERGNLSLIVKSVEGSGAPKGGERRRKGEAFAGKGNSFN